MAGVNKVMIIGNLGKDPELRHTPQGNAVANFSIATSESWNDKNGQKQERTEWHRIVVWGKLAELCAKYLSKGRQCFIEGKLQTRAWEGQDGQKKYTTEVIASTVQFLGGPGQNAERSSGADNSDPFGAPPDFENEAPSQTDDIPF